MGERGYPEDIDTHPPSSPSENRYKESGDCMTRTPKKTIPPTRPPRTHHPSLQSIPLFHVYMTTRLDTLTYPAPTSTTIQPSNHSYSGTRPDRLDAATAASHSPPTNPATIPRNASLNSTPTPEQQVTRVNPRLSQTGRRRVGDGGIRTTRRGKK